MESLGMLVFVAGLVVSAVGTLWFLLTAFRESILWGLACLLLPFVSAIFLIVHWREAGKPFLVSLAGGFICLIGMSMAPATSGWL